MNIISHILHRRNALNTWIRAATIDCCLRWRQYWIRESSHILALLLHARPPRNQHPSPASAQTAVLAPASTPTSPFQLHARQADSLLPQSCMTCKQEFFGSSGVAVPSGAVSVSGGGGSSSQTSFCVDQTNPNLVIMYRKINACADAWRVPVNSVLTMLCILISVAFGLMPSR